MVDTDMTSDMLIFNILKNSNDAFIKSCKIKFIDKSVPAMEDNTIYVANIDLEYLESNFNGTTYKALVNLFVKTKETDYMKSSRYLRTVVKHIKNVLGSELELKKRAIVFRNITYDYGSNYTLKGLHMLVQLRENEKFGNDPVDVDCINIDLEDNEEE